MIWSMKIQKVIHKIIEFLFPSFAYVNKTKTDSRDIAMQLYPAGFARALLLEEFIELFKKTQMFDSQSINVAVIGGSSQDPELFALKHLGLEINLTIFGIDPQVEYLDLNTINPKNSKFQFDLILCSQVVEHLWNHGAAFDSLKNLMTEDTYVWISCPSSNRPHGLNFYYSAGLTSSFLVKNLEHRGLKILGSGSIGTRRLYRAIHTQPSWLSVRGHKFPPLWSFEEHPYDKQGKIYRTMFRLRYFVRNMELLMFSRKITTDIRCATESWACAKIDSSKV
jgi:hypothetical protein